MPILEEMSFQCLPPRRHSSTAYGRSLRSCGDNNPSLLASCYTRTTGTRVGYSNCSCGKRESPTAQYAATKLAAAKLSSLCRVQLKLPVDRWLTNC